jgi:hypothetical protein
VLKSKQKTRTLKSTTPAYRKAPYKTRAEAVQVQEWFDGLRKRAELERQMWRDLMYLEDEIHRAQQDKALQLGLGAFIVVLTTIAITVAVLAV